MEEFESKWKAAFEAAVVGDCEMCGLRIPVAEISYEGMEEDSALLCALCSASPITQQYMRRGKVTSAELAAAIQRNTNLILQALMDRKEDSTREETR